MKEDVLAILHRALDTLVEGYFSTESAQPPRVYFTDYVADNLRFLIEKGLAKHPLPASKVSSGIDTANSLLQEALGGEHTRHLPVYQDPQERVVSERTLRAFAETVLYYCAQPDKVEARVNVAITELSQGPQKNEPALHLYVALVKSFCEEEQVKLSRGMRRQLESIDRLNERGGRS